MFDSDGGPALPAALLPVALTPRHLTRHNLPDNKIAAPRR
ncbi:hypothetical protein SBBP1_120023 [Burkholderiales bacterium]|nr:hypothetical protein SBBP1_120023 [Burkholderiales bacterium]